MSDLCDAAVQVAHDGLSAYPLGAAAVTWTATDASGNGSTAAQAVTVEDTTPPEVACNAPETITPFDPPVSFTASATDVCDAAPSAVIRGFDCFRLTNRGQRIHGRCAVALAGDTLTILDPGGVGDHIEWTVEAADASGNRTPATCAVLVVPPRSRTGTGLKPTSSNWLAEAAAEAHRASPPSAW